MSCRFQEIKLTKPLKTIIRADACAQIGGGHIMRCLTLADELARRGDRCVFAVRPGSVETVPKLAQSGHEVVILAGPLSDEASEIEERVGKCGWLIVDHYGLGAQFEQATRGFAQKIMVIDDLADRPHDCDLLLDQTYGRQQEDYVERVPDGARLLMGTDYALLRPEFAALRPKALARRDKCGPVRRILISLGASDPHGVTAKALLAVKESGIDVRVDVVIGSGDPAAMGLVEIAQTMPQQIDFRGFDADIAELMYEADLAIGAGGSTSWERCCLGLPTLMIVTADNQEKVAEELAKAGAVMKLSACTDFQVDQLKNKILQLSGEDHNRLQMIKCAFDICDGFGVNRAAQYFDPDYAKDNREIRLRKVINEDCLQLFEWQSHPDTRRFSNNAQAPSWKEHQAWFSNKLMDPFTILNIITQNELNAGVLRLDMRSQTDGKGYTVSIFIGPENKQCGIGSTALRAARKLVGITDLYAEIDPLNTASLGLFLGAGYEQISKRWFVQKGYEKAVSYAE